MADIKRLYVMKKQGFDVEATKLFKELKTVLGIRQLDKVKILQRYDMQNVSDELFDASKNTIFSEPAQDNTACSLEELIGVYEEVSGIRILPLEYVPGQYDQRADSAAQCMQLQKGTERPVIKTARIIILYGALTDEDFQAIKDYMLNPLESRIASMELPFSLEEPTSAPPPVKTIEGFLDFDETRRADLIGQLGLAMTEQDLAWIHKYFQEKEKRDPTHTEILVLDTYWSDHCRHSTFLTHIESVTFDSDPSALRVKKAYQRYLDERTAVYANADRPVCLMDVATLAMKRMRQQGLLDDLDVSDEVNACSIVVKADMDGQPSDWLVMFKNETHNHPTEIEPFGGAATCLGGAIRDPLSGRSYVYQAMRITGSADPRTDVSKTLQGKLPQIKITTGAAQGYSSYGNQVGVATGYVQELYHPDFVAKRMEVGAVIGAAPKENVVRKKPSPGDVVILIGGRTGRDGCGGATGSSKEHDEESLYRCGAEVQKGNAPTERKIQRLFRNPSASVLIKKCNDFGAGGVSVAIGELAEGLDIHLDAVPKKYEGLDGTELAISESQERMAVVTSKEDAETLINMAQLENLEAVIVADVTDLGRVRMFWNGQTIFDISRAFIETNGVTQTTKVHISKMPIEDNRSKTTPDEDVQKRICERMENLRFCSRKGLVEMFDSTIGAGTVLMPFGGKYALTMQEGMAAKLPTDCETTTCTLMSYGYDPYVSKQNTFYGGVYAVIESLSKIAAMGGDVANVRMSFQEYFEKPLNDPKKWGKPMAALLGAFEAQMAMGTPAIGGKDSMSGNFKDLTVPPTLISFALAVAHVQRVRSAEFKSQGHSVYKIALKKDGEGLPDYEYAKRMYQFVYKHTPADGLVSAATVTQGGAIETIVRMCMGNRLGVSFLENVKPEGLFEADTGSMIVEMDASCEKQLLEADLLVTKLGCLNDKYTLAFDGCSVDLSCVERAWREPLESVFPTKAEATDVFIKKPETESFPPRKAKARVARPRVCIPIFPGTNCEYDTIFSFEKAGACAKPQVFCNSSPTEIADSIECMVKAIGQSQILMIPGGFSAGDEPEGSGKFVAAVFRNPRLEEATMNFLDRNDGLILGICNGFQALIKLGLVPYGKIIEQSPNAPTLTVNAIGRHCSRMVRTRVASVRSPWLYGCDVGDVFTIPVSHGEGRFIATFSDIEQLAKNGQIATQYVDENDCPSGEVEDNPNGSFGAVEGITSEDGKIFGKMGHVERIGPHLYKNVPGQKDMLLFLSGVSYFT